MSQVGCGYIVGAGIARPRTTNGRPYIARAAAKIEVCGGRRAHRKCPWGISTSRRLSLWESSRDSG